MRAFHIASSLVLLVACSNSDPTTPATDAGPMDASEGADSSTADATAQTDAPADASLFDAAIADAAIADALTSDAASTDAVVSDAPTTDAFVSVDASLPGSSCEEATPLAINTWVTLPPVDGRTDSECRISPSLFRTVAVPPGQRFDLRTLTPASALDGCGASCEGAEGGLLIFGVHYFPVIHNTSETTATYVVELDANEASTAFADVGEVTTNNTCSTAMLLEGPDTLTGLANRNVGAPTYTVTGCDAVRSERGLSYSIMLNAGSTLTAATTTTLAPDVSITVPPSVMILESCNDDTSTAITANAEACQSVGNPEASYTNSGTEATLVRMLVSFGTAQRISLTVGRSD